MGPEVGTRAHTAWVALVAIAITMGTAGCGGPTRTSGSGPMRVIERSPVPLSLEISPPDRAGRQPVSTEIGIALTGGRVMSVRVVRTGGRGQVNGVLRDDLSAWVPTLPLAFGATYTATVVATDGAKTLRRRTRSAPWPHPPGRPAPGYISSPARPTAWACRSWSSSTRQVPRSRRAEVQRRLFVRSDPPQPGVWHWFGGRQVLYRPPSHWRPGTVLTVRAALRGVPMGGAYYGDADRSARVHIGRALRLDVDNRTKRMTVFAGHRLLRRIPVSLGKASTPSSSGRLVIMSKEYSTIFDTRREGPNGYRVRINYAQRVTWGGEFIHAAPWSVGDQGHRNVSHGCVNISWENAEWLFGRTHIGDPVTVRGTGVHIEPGNGWTVWDMPWRQYVKGSALPVPAALAGAQGD
jgi:lipoprotein-anchoring transpeptidase ErfK/SrfK